MNYLFRLSVGIVIIIYLSGCSENGEKDLDSVNKSTNIQEGNSAINPPSLPSVSDNPAVLLNK